VCSDPEVAAVVIDSGIPVVLCGPDGVALADALRVLRDSGGRVEVPVGGPDGVVVADASGAIGNSGGPMEVPVGGLGLALADALRVLRDGGGRVAVLVGDPADPDVKAAALGMARELFGGEPVVV
jgi:hypothetical protein